MVIKSEELDNQQNYRKYKTETAKFLTQFGISDCFIFRIIQMTLNNFLS